MSQRHRKTEVPLLHREELRAQAHSERHRVHVALHRVAQQVSAGLEPDDAPDPGRQWRPTSNHDPEVAKKKLAKQKKRNRRHWKTKMWKRRTNLRRQKNEELLALRNA